MLVDFDGSLAPIIDDPDASRPLPAARGRCGCARRPGASRRGREWTAGRIPHDRIALDGLTYVGQYGLQRWVEGRVITDPRVEPFLAAVEEIATAAAEEVPGVLVERKDGVAVVLHCANGPSWGGGERLGGPGGSGGCGRGSHQPVGCAIHRARHSGARQSPCSGHPSGRSDCSSAAQTAAFLVVGLPAGAWIDRMLKRRVMIIADVVRAVALGHFPLLWFAGALEIWHLYVVGAIVGVATVFFDV